MTSTSLLPQGWTIATIEELCYINPKHDPTLTDETPVSFVPMSDVDDVTGELRTTSVRPFMEVRTGYTHFADGDVLLAKITPCMENGKAAVARGLEGGIGCGSTEFFVLRTKGAIDPHYLHRFVRQSEYRKVARAAMTGVVGQARVPRSFVEQTEIPLPPLAEQKRIVAKIEELTARSRRAKEALDAVPPLLDQLRQSILAAAFRGDLTADWRAKNPNVEPADQLLARIRTERRARWEAAASDRTRTNYREAEPRIPLSPPFELPRGWAWATADMCAWEITVGHVGPMQHRYSETGIPFLRSQNVRENRFSEEGLLYIPNEFHSELRKSSLSPGDLVIVRSGAPGTACIIPESLPEANCSDLVICRLVPCIKPDLACFFINSQYARSQVVDAQVGVAQQHFNVGSMRKLVMPVIPAPEQAVLLERVRGAFSLASRIEENLLSATRDCAVVDAAVLAKAFRGELVPQDPNDEPASVLLDRIRAARAESSAAPRRRGRAGPSAASEEVEDEGRRSQAPAARPAETGAAVAAPPRRGRPPKAAPRAPEPEPESSPAPSRRAHARAPDSESPPAPARRPPPPTAEPAPAPDSPPARRPGSPAADLTALDPDALRDHVFAALWTHGPLDKDAAVRRLADHLRQAGLVDYQRLRADGPLYTALLATIESAAKAGTLDRPGRGLLRASKPDPTTYTIDDWRHALLATLPQTPTDREEAIRAAAEWSRHHLGLQFTRLRADGHIITGLRYALNSAIRRHEITRHGPTLISRSHNPTQLPLTLDPPTPRRP